jgi:type IV secretory pathway VirJ component
MGWRLRCALALCLAVLLASGGAYCAIVGSPPRSELGLRFEAAASGGDTVAVIYSGDGGWGPLDQVLARDLRRAGTPVIGYNALLYFLPGRTADGAAGDLAAVLRRSMAAWGKSRIILIGYSFGADALPAIYPRLPADLRARTRLVALLSPGAYGELRFQPGEWFDWPGRASYPLRLAVEDLKGAPMICTYGDHEKAPVCPTLPAGVITPVELTGGHHYGGHYHRLSRAVLRAAGLRAQA